MKTRNVLACLLCAGLAIFIWKRGAEDPSPEDLSEYAASDESSDMDITGLEIHQGEDGRELWNLRATRAVMAQQDGDIVAENPFLTYYIRESASTGAGASFSSSGQEEETVTVQSGSGDVNQRENRIRFAGDVVVKRKEDVLYTNLLIYEGQDRSMFCPETSTLIRPGLRGESAELLWNLADNVLFGKNGVSITLETERRIERRAVSSSAR
ncbi:MAG: LPS export ABC transporter periplasmic protein LptC [Deltaproteobacteria bacterium]|nr:LPS export ABC transporter periplasmic protein LptC [Deltaproteobacteria bacterium]